MSNLEKCLFLLRENSANENFEKNLDYEDYVETVKVNLRDKIGTLNGISFKSIDKINPTIKSDFFSKIDLLIIEDESRTIGSLIDFCKKNKEIQSILICDSVQTVDTLMTKEISDPGLITLDFALSPRPDYEKTLKLYNKIKKHWPSSIILGLSNFENNSIVKKLEECIRTNKDSVYDKFIFLKDDIFPALLRNYSCIAQNYQKAIREKKECQKAKESAEQELYEVKMMQEVYGTFGLRFRAKQLEGLDEISVPKYYKKEFIFDESIPSRIAMKFMARCKEKGFEKINIYGERGVGKESIASTIHKESFGTQAPFAAFNCGTLSDSNLIYSKLFGHKKNSFTGAHSDHKGYLEQADGGTLFLDEIHLIPQDIQEHLLRALEECKILPLGATKEVKVKFKLITGANVDLYEEASKRKKIRLDFYDRIRGLPIVVAPLRSRGEDAIRILANNLLNREILTKQVEESKKFSEAAENKLLNHSFPGNIRELKTVITNAIFYSDGVTIEADDIDFGPYSMIDISQINKKMINSTFDSSRLPLAEKWLNEYDLAIQIAIKKTNMTDKKLSQDLVAKFLKGKEINRTNISQNCRSYFNEILHLFSLTENKYKWQCFRRQLEQGGINRKLAQSYNSWRKK